MVIIVIKYGFVLLVHKGYFFFFKQKTAYEMRISDWSSTCALPISARVKGRRAALARSTSVKTRFSNRAPKRSSEAWMRSILQRSEPRPMSNSVPPRNGEGDRPKGGGGAGAGLFDVARAGNTSRDPPPCFAWSRSAEHKSALQPLQRISYAVVCAKK